MPITIKELFNLHSAFVRYFYVTTYLGTMYFTFAKKGNGISYERVNPQIRGLEVPKKLVRVKWN